MHCPFCQERSSNTKICSRCGAALESDLAKSLTLNQPLPNRTRLDEDRYEIRKPIAAGGFGITYQALHKATLEVVTLKEYHPADLVERNPNGSLVAKRGAEQDFLDGLHHFEQEAASLSKLQHPSIVRIHDSFRQFGTAFLVLDYLEGKTLSERIAQGTPLELIEAAKIAQQILGALAVVHNAAMLHRDIKPSNIILTAGRAVLIDFGSVGRLGKPTTSRLLTPLYAALEQYSQSAVLVPQTDLYSFAATLFEAFCGSPPPSALDRANGVSLQMPQSIPETFRMALFEALALQIGERPKSALQMQKRMGLTPEAKTWGPDSRAV